MAVFKCKMCGGSLDILDSVSVATCEYCGTKQTISKSRDEVVLNLFSRANNLRLKCEFDKAEQVYEKILDIDNTDAEAHWGIVLCKYGIEYVEDPKTYSRIPTCHRTLYEAVLSDVNFLAAIENADEKQRDLYIAEAKVIDQLQKNILNIVNSEEPFDVFICYKETDENGKRTIDSAITNDIYYQLTEEGFKVFYAPITLEDKLGHEYEPYIFAALNSAKVMLVVGTKPEYFDSVWVRNEWSRFFKAMKNDRSKLLIPCYRDMDVYELPNEFAHLQAQDMGKIGFISDVIRGLKKVFKNDIIEEPIRQTSVSRDISLANIPVLLKRGFMVLEDGDFEKAKKIAEQILTFDPECSDAYLIKLMADLKIQKFEQFTNYKKNFENNGNYKKAVRFGNNKLKQVCENNVKKIAKQKLEKKKKRIKRAKIIIPITAVVLAVTSFFMFFNFNMWTDITAVYTSGKGYSDGHTIGLKKDGTVVAVGNNYSGQCNVDKWTNIVSVSASMNHTVGLKKDGTVLAVGTNYLGQCNVESWSDIVSIYAGYGYTVGLKRDGTVVATGSLDGLSQVHKWNNIVSVTGSFSHIVGLKKDGTVVATGNNDYGQCNVSNWSNIGDVFTIDSQYSKEGTVGLKKDGTVIATYCNVDNWTDIVSISAGVCFVVGLKKDGTVVAAGTNGNGQCNVNNWTDIVSISAGNSFVVGLKKDGTVVATGVNYEGQCNVEYWTDIIAISAGSRHTVGLKKDGTVVAVGDFTSGQCDVRRTKYPFKNW